MKRKQFMLALGFGIPFAILMIISNAVLYGKFSIPILISGVLSGVLTGLLFARGIKYFASRFYTSIVVDLNQDEKIIKEAGANHFKGVEAVGGKLVLTNDRLIFKSHRFNVQNHEEFFHLDEIKKIAATKNLNVLKNGLRLELVNNESHRFVVDAPTEWVKEIEDTYTHKHINT